MQNILAKQAASITELKNGPRNLIENAAGKPIAIIDNNTITAYLISNTTYEKISDMLNDSN